MQTRKTMYVTGQVEQYNICTNIIRISFLLQGVVRDQPLASGGAIPAAPPSYEDSTAGGGGGGPAIALPPPGAAIAMPPPGESHPPATEKTALNKDGDKAGYTPGEYPHTKCVHFFTLWRYFKCRKLLLLTCHNLNELRGVVLSCLFGPVPLSHTFNVFCVVVGFAPEKRKKN